MRKVENCERDCRPENCRCDRENEAALGTQPVPVAVKGLESADDDPMRAHFTCRREDDAGGTPGFTLYMTKMGAHGEYQLYRNEAEALWVNLGKALSFAPVQAVPGDMVSAAIADIAVERQRQISAEGWTPEHDDQHKGAELAAAAASYTLNASIDEYSPTRVAAYWPWDKAWWKPANRRRDLVKAGALIAAEIDRLDRLAAQAPLASGRWG